MGVISEFIRVTITASQPVSSPTLTQLLILGTTPGKAVKDELKVYSNTTTLAGDFDPSDEEYKLGQVVFAQGNVLNRPDKVYVFNGTRTEYRLGTVTTGLLANNNALTWTADKYGDYGDRVKFQFVIGDASTTHSLVGVGQDLPLGSVPSDNAITFTQAADSAEIVRISVIDPELPNQTLGIQVKNFRDLVPVSTGTTKYRDAQNIFDWNIEISLATDVTENVITTAQEVVDALTDAGDPAYNALAAKLVDAANTVGSDGTAAIDWTSDKTMIPVELKIQVGVDAGRTIAERAWELRDWANENDTIGPLLLVDDQTVSNGTGLVTTSAVNEVQTATVDGASSGTFTLTFRGQETSAIAYDATPAAVLAALQALSNVGDNDVLVTDNSGDWDIEFVGALAGEPIGTDFTFDGASLVGGSSPGLSVATAGVTDWNQLDRISNATASGLELTRMAIAAINEAQKSKIEFPYFWICTSREEVDGDTSELSQFIATQRAIYITTNADDENVAEIRQRIDALVSDRTGFAAHDDPAVRLDAAIAGYFKALTQAFVAGGNGAFSLFWGALNTIPAAEWTDTDRATLFGFAPGAAGAITYVEDFDTAPGTFVIAGSWSTSGDYLDRRWKKDWMILQMTLTIFLTLRRNVGGIPYDNEGIGILEGATEERMANFTLRRLVAARDKARSKGIYILDFPRLESGRIEQVDWDNRTYKASLQFQEAGVIEQVDLVMESGFFATAFAGQTSA